MDRRAHDEDADREETPRRARAEVFRSCMLDEKSNVTRRAISDTGLAMSLLRDSRTGRGQSEKRQSRNRGSCSVTARAV